MGLIARAKNIILTPKTEWDVIAAEATPPGKVVMGYALPLAAGAAVAQFIGVSLLMGGIFSALGARHSMTGGLAGLVIGIVMAIVGIFVLAFIVDALAPTFGGQKDMSQAVKVVAYSYTAAWVFGLLEVIPVLGWIAALVGGLYGLYLLYLGLPKLMKSPPEKSVPYLVVVIVCAIVLWIVIGIVTATTAAMFAPSMTIDRSSSVTYDKDSRLGQLEEFSKKMEAAGKKMEDAQKGGDPSKQMEAAMGALGTALSGGKGVEPVQLDVLKPFMPDRFAGMPRTDEHSERSGVAGLMVAKAAATYGGDGKSVDLEVVDTGGAAGLMGLASWMGIQGEKEDANRRESTRKEGNRVIHEQVDKRGGSNEYTVVVGDRFVVTATGHGVGIDALKAGVGSVDLRKLEATK